MSQTQRLIRMAEVTQRTGLSKSSIYRLESANQFPQRVKLSERAIAWPESAVVAWIADRMAASAAQAA